MTRQIILIGFKHTGKSAIGARLAEVLGRQFLDLDEVSSGLHYHRVGETLAVREIVRSRGESYFRQLEIDALKQSLTRAEALVVASGGGTPMHSAAQALMKPHMVVWVKAPKGITFERIMTHGRPAFFPEGAEPYQAFCEVLTQRLPVYERLANFTVENTGSIQDAVKSIVAKLALKTEKL